MTQTFSPVESLPVNLWGEHQAPPSEKVTVARELMATADRLYYMLQGPHPLEQGFERLQVGKALNYVTDQLSALAQDIEVREALCAQVQR